MSCCQYKALLNCIINARFSQLTHLTPFLKHSLDFYPAGENEKNRSGGPKPVDSWCWALGPRGGIINISFWIQAALLLTPLSIRCPPSPKDAGCGTGWFSQLRRFRRVKVSDLFFNQQRISIAVALYQRGKVSCESRAKRCMHTCRGGKVYLTAVCRVPESPLFGGRFIVT